MITTRPRYTPRQIALLPGDAQRLVVVEADHNEFNQAEAEVCGAVAISIFRAHVQSPCNSVAFAAFVLLAVCFVLCSWDVEFWFFLRLDNPR